ncbi:MAG: sigma-70 family RNA polymerase sigma factor [Patescibacteria group bacterium]|jgi:RNA polymerase sigma-70 factor (ECF subfamily)|nr:sigma-70 family RNA polymerase sigma factor [Patescibacteria group bacterium]
MEKLSIIQLVKKCQQGEVDYFTQLYDEYVDKIYKFIYYKTWHQETAEDLTSEVFLKALKNIQNYNVNKAHFSTWLYQIARYSVIDYYRRYKTEINIEDIWDLDDGIDLEQDIVNRELLNKIRNLLKTLKPQQREIIILRVWQGLNYQEISQITGQTSASLRMMVGRVLKLIRQQDFNLLVLICLIKLIKI